MNSNPESDNPKTILTGSISGTASNSNLTPNSGGSEDTSDDCANTVLSSDPHHIFQIRGTYLSSDRHAGRLIIESALRVLGDGARGFEITEVRPPMWLQKCAANHGGFQYYLHVAHNTPRDFWTQPEYRATGVNEFTFEALVSQGLSVYEENFPAMSSRKR